MKQFIILASIILFAHSLPIYSQYPTRCNLGSEAAATCVLGGAAVAGAYGLYKLGSWLFNPTDEKVLEYAKSSYNEALAKYDKIYAVLRDGNPSISNSDDIIYNSSETLLYQIGLEKHYDGPTQNYIHRLNSTLSTLESRKKKLTERINTQYNNESLWIYDQMRVYRKKIETMLSGLYILRDYLNHHKNYFILFELESRLIDRYKQECDELSRHPYDDPYLNNAIRRSIMMRQTQNYHRYPFIYYADMISRDIDLLYNTIRSCSYNYHNRLACSQDLYNKLISIKGIVVSSHEYHTELIERDRAELQERELAIQQQQLHALHQQNQLLDQYAYNNRADITITTEYTM